MMTLVSIILLVVSQSQWWLYVCYIVGCVTMIVVAQLLLVTWFKL